MSSAILYVAIVAIWIGVLVPRWLRHEHAHDGHLRLRRFAPRSSRQQASGAAVQAGFSEDGRPRDTSLGGSAERPQVSSADASDVRKRDPLSQINDNGYVSAPVSGNNEGTAQPAGMAPSPVRSYGWSAEEYVRQERVSQRGPRGGKRLGENAAASHGGEPATLPARDSGEHPGTAGHERRMRVIRGRRRMLWMLLVLAAAAMGLAYLGLAAWWIAVPPAVLLTGYLLLLREAAHADAEARERHARERAAAMARRAREARQAADAQREADTGSSPAWTETLPPAEIIDISERIGDQLYDQYADAKLRAVGD